jgi:hypothetical protein
MPIIRAAAVCTLALSVAATATVMPRGYAAVPMPFVSYLNQATTRETFFSAVVSPFRRLDKNGDGLVAAELELPDAMERAQRRAGNLSKFYAFDLNGDGRIERAEIERANAAPQSPDGVYCCRVNVDKRAGELMKADRNHDGAIDFEEARNYWPVQRGYGSRAGRELLGLDPNKDGRLTLRELETLVHNAFDTVDIDGNGILSGRERRLFEDATRTAYIAYQNMSNSSCGMPKPAPAHRFAVIGPLIESRAVSSVAIAGQDQETTVSVVDIEPGTQPLHILVMSSGVRIWQFRGATSRVAHVAVATVSHQSAVAGVLQNRVTFLPSGDCMFPVSNNAGTVRTMTQALLETVGRAPDSLLMDQGAGRIVLPTSKLVPMGNVPTVGPTGWNMGAFFYGVPPTVIKIDPKALVTVDPVEPYDVLPNDAGLYQLMKESALVFQGASTGQRTFKIVKPIKRYPGGLGGGEAVTFVLADGVPLPPGRPGHSCVRAENGKPIALPGAPSTMCR